MTSHMSKTSRLSNHYDARKFSVVTRQTDTVPDYVLPVVKKENKTKHLLLQGRRKKNTTFFFYFIEMYNTQDAENEDRAALTLS